MLLFVGARIMPLKKAVPVVIIIVLLFSNMIRMFRVYKYGIADPGPDTANLIFTKISTSVPTRIDNIMFGILGAYLSFYRFSIWTNYRNLLFVTGLIGYFCNHFYKAFTDFNLYNILFQGQVELLFILMTFPKIGGIQKGKGAVASVITFISTISYSIYLVHLSLFIHAVMPRFPQSVWYRLPVYFLWAFGGGYLLHNTVEKWGLKYRKKLRQRATIKDNPITVTVV
jgi:peptidoglycan/LPS O-acetylase OafA/YrhL